MIWRVLRSPKSNALVRIFSFPFSIVPWLTAWASRVLSSSSVWGSSWCAPGVTRTPVSRSRAIDAAFSSQMPG
jgi:hypothetical protein